MSEERSTVRMSEEEHGILSTLIKSVGELTSNVRALTENQVRLDKVVTHLADKGALSWEKMGHLVLVVLAAVGPLGLLITMKMDNRVAPLERDAAVAEKERAAQASAQKTFIEDYHAERAEDRKDMKEAIAALTQQKADFLDRNAKQDQQIGEVYYHDFGHYPRP